MIQPPCYDRVNNKDCPDRQEVCMKLGRSKCPKWVAYEEQHKIDLDERNRERQKAAAQFEHSRKLRQKINNRAKH